MESSLHADRQLTFSVEVITETETADSISSGGSGGRKRGRKGSNVGFPPSLFSIDDDSFGRGARWREAGEGKMLVNMESGVRWPKSVWKGKGGSR